MNWDDVRMFLAVARTGQLLSASRRLGVNHATLSRRVAALEKEKVACKLLTVEGAGHAFSKKQNAEVVLPALLGWFEQHLGKKE